MDMTEAKHDRDIAHIAALLLSLLRRSDKETDLAWIAARGVLGDDTAAEYVHFADSFGAALQVCSNLRARALIAEMAPRVERIAVDVDYEMGDRHEPVPLRYPTLELIGRRTLLVPPFVADAGELAEELTDELILVLGEDGPVVGGLGDEITDGDASRMLGQAVAGRDWGEQEVVTFLELLHLAARACDHHRLLELREGNEFSAAVSC